MRNYTAPVIEYPDRYDAAVKARIYANATQTRRASGWPPTPPARDWSIGSAPPPTTGAGSC